MAEFVDNLKLQEQLTKTIRDRQTVLMAQTREMNSQLQVALQLKDVMDNLSSNDLTGKLEETQKALESVSQNAQVLNKTSSQAMNSIILGAKNATIQSGKFEKSLRLIIQKYPMLGNAATAAFTGMTKGFDSVLTIGQSLFGVFTSLIDAAYQFGKGVLSIPLRIFQGLVKTAADFTGDTSLMQAFENLRKVFGSFKEDVSRNVIKSFHEIQKGFTIAGMSAFRVLGPFSQQLEYFTKQFENLGAQVHLFGKSIASDAGAFVAFQKGLGVADDQMKSFTDRAATFGTTWQEQFRLTANYSLQMGKSFDIPQKMLAKDISKMIADVKNFGGVTQKEMTQTSVYFRKLGIEVDKVTSLMEKFDTFESTADSMAQLNQAFGATVNAFELMKAQSPAEKFDLLKKAMNATGKSTENMTYQEKKLLAQTTGLDEATSNLAFSAKNQGLSLDEIKRKSVSAEKAQLSQVQVLAKLNDSIERFIMQGEHLNSSFFNIFLEGFERGVKVSKPFMQLMMNIRQALMKTMFAGRDVGLTFMKYFPGISDVVENLAKMFSPAKFSKLLSGVTSSFAKFFKDVDSGPFSLKNLLENIRTNFLNWFDSNSPEGQKMLEGVKKIFRTMSGLVGQGIAFVVENLTKGLNTLADFVKDPMTFLQNLKGGATKQTQGLLSPLINALSDPKLWKDLWGSVKNLFNVVFSKIKTYFTSSDFTSIVKEYWPYIAGAIFAPALTNVLAATFVNVLLRAVTVSTGKVANIIKGGTGGITSAVEKVVSAGKGSQLGEKAIPNEKAIGSVGGIVGNLSKLTTLDILKAGKNAVLLSAFIGVSLVAMITAIGASAKILESMKIDSTSFVQTLEGIGVIAVASIPLIFAVKMASMVAKTSNIKDLTIGIASIGAIVLAMGVTLAGIRWIFKDIKQTELTTAVSVMESMSTVFLKAALLAIPAAAIGALMMGPQGIYVGAAVASGFGVLTTMIGVMGVSIIEIMKSLNSIPMGGDVGSKVTAFTEIMKSIGLFTENITSIMSSVHPSFIELIRGKSSMIDNMKELSSFIESLLGKAGSSDGLTGIIDTIMSHAREISASPQILSASKLIVDLFSSIGTLASALLPPPNTLSTLDKVFDIFRSKKNQTIMQVSGHVKRMIGMMVPFISEIFSAISSLSMIKFDEKSVSAAESFAKIIEPITMIIKAITPSPELLKSARVLTKTSQLIGPNIEVDKFDSTAFESLSTFFSSIFQSIQPLIETMTNTIVSTIIDKARLIRKKDFEGIRLVLDIIGSVSSLVSSLANITGNIAADSLTTKTGDITKTILDASGTFQRIFEVIRDNVGELIVNVISAASSFNGIGDIGSKLTIVKKSMETVGSIASAIKSFDVFTSDDKNIDPYVAVAKINKSSELIRIVFRKDGSFSEMIKSINDVFGKGISGINQDAMNGVKNIVSVTESVTKVANSLDSFIAQSNMLNEKFDIMIKNDTFGKQLEEKMANSFINPDMFFVSLNGIASGVNDDVKLALNTTKEIVDSVNELNKVLSSGDGTNIQLSTKLKSFAQSANLRGMDKMTIENKGVSINVSMNVTMNAADLEETLIYRDTSVIRKGIQDSHAFDSDQPTKTKLQSF